MLQVIDRSTRNLKGILEDKIVLIDSWEHPANLMVVQTKSSLCGYPLILGKPWLATTNSYIHGRLRDMIITRGGKRACYWDCQFCWDC